MKAEKADKMVDLALAEDTGRGDVTTQALIPADLSGRAPLLAKPASWPVSKSRSGLSSCRPVSRVGSPGTDGTAAARRDATSRGRWPAS